jgi:shikimate 5-dehydrogenase
MAIQNFGVFGYPINHSLSPVMHTAAFSALGMNDCEYKAYAVLPENLEDAVLKAKADGFKGLNITIPHKEKILSIGIVEPDAFAKKAGAVNTLLFSGDGVKGYNTDALGALAALEYGGAETDGKNILIIGAGGAARSISFLFGERQNCLKIINRTAEKAANLAVEISEKTGNQNVSGSGFSTAWDDLEKADIIIQTTELGMGKYENVSFFDQLKTDSDDEKEGRKKEMISKCLNPETVVFDIVYNPRETKFLKEAREAGAQTMNGMMMLVFQGALAFEIWTGKKPDVNVMANAVLKELETKNE